MRRRAVALAILLLVVISAITAWWRWSDRRQVSGSPTASGSPASSSGAAVTAADLVLQVNGAAGARVPVGSAVFFTVTLIGSAPESWMTSVRFVTTDDKPFASQMQPLGQPLTFTFARDRRAGTADAAAQNQEENALPMHRAEYGTGPEESARIPPGAYTVRVLLPVDRSVSASGTLVSNTVTLTVDGPDTTGPATAAEKARLESAANFNLLAEKWDEAHRLALQLVAREDADTSAYTLLGDALNGLKRDSEALAAYQEALSLVPPDLDEAPNYLIVRMEEIHARLEAANPQKGPPK
jgi:hypothetical protein